MIKSELATKVAKRLKASDIWQSHKLVRRMPMTRLEYNNYQSLSLPKGEDGTDAGYLVEYLDGGKPNHPNHENYISWTPKKQFADGYRKQELKSTEDGESANDVIDAVDVVCPSGHDGFQLLCALSNKDEQWASSTKAMKLSGVGCIVQVTTVSKGSITESLCFVPGITIVPDTDKGHGMKLIRGL